MCESRGGRPGLPAPNKPTVSVDVKQQSTNFFFLFSFLLSTLIIILSNCFRLKIHMRAQGYDVVTLI